MSLGFDKTAKQASIAKPPPERARSYQKIRSKHTSRGGAMHENNLRSLVWKLALTRSVCSRRSGGRGPTFMNNERLKWQLLAGITLSAALVAAPTVANAADAKPASAAAKASSAAPAA